MTERVMFKGTVTREGRNIRASIPFAGQRTKRNGEWVEVDPAALVKADASNAVGRVNHNPDSMLARMSNGTLQIDRSETGVDFLMSNVPETTEGNDTLTLLDGGYFGGASFEIDGLKSTFSTDPDGTRVRRYTSIKSLLDVSVVIDPAFKSTVAAFGKDTGMTDIAEPELETPAPEKPKDVAQFTAAPVSDIFATAEAFARKQDPKALALAMANLVNQPEMSPAETEAYNAFAKVADEHAATDATNRDRFERIKLGQRLRAGLGPKAPESAGDVFASDEYAAGFDQYLRTGKERYVEQFAQSIAGTGAEGGYTVPDGYLNRLVQRLKAYGGIAGVSDEITTSTGESLRFPTIDDTANTAAIAAEGAAGAAGADLVFGSVDLAAYSYSANGAGNVGVKLSLELLQDSAIDIGTRVADLLAIRIGRKQASDLANGGGSGAPVGLFTKTPDAMTATAVSLAGPEHIMQVDAAYRDGGNCRWIMSDTTLVKLWQSQTTTNEPLFIPGGADIVNAPGGRFYGYPITIDAAAGTKVAFGDFRAGYIIRRVRGVQIIVDPYTLANVRQVSYNAWARMDANIQDSFAYSVSEWSTVSADT